MTLGGSQGISRAGRISISLLALAGTLLILLPSSRHGAGISPDSVGYIAAARNLIAGEGLLTFNGSPLAAQPPLYPALLALAGWLCGKDPLLIAHVVNSLLFGLMVYLSGMLAFRHLGSVPAFAFVGTVAVTVSAPVFELATMAWSEPLFICVVLLCLVLADLYVAKDDRTYVLALSAAVAVSCIVRHIGIALISWGMVLIALYHRGSGKTRFTRCMGFMLVSALPVTLWAIRNCAVSGTPFGGRTASTFTLAQNLAFTFRTMFRWYVPGRLVEHPLILGLLCVAGGMLAGLLARDGWHRLREVARRTGPLAILVAAYTAFLIVSAGATAFNRIGDRLLSPVYGPLTLLILIAIEAMTDRRLRARHGRVAAVMLVAVLGLWLVYPLRATVLLAAETANVGVGYSGEDWRESQTIRYLLDHRSLRSECPIYTNAADVTYILADLSAKTSPPRTDYGSVRAPVNPAALRGRWPEEGKACLVWFDRIDRSYLLTPDELATIARMEEVARLEDGRVYRVARE